ncbi:hypothetical protein MY11210_000412 [Beauveria gryllotalpidicola]
MRFNSFLTLASAVGLASIVAADDAHSNLDWYGPKQFHTQVCGHPGDEHPENCNDLYNDVRDELHKKVMDTCKEASCAGSFEHYRFQRPSSRPRPRASHHAHTAIETKFTIPSKMILNRFGDGNEKGHLTMTVTVDDEDGLCETLSEDWNRWQRAPRDN